MNKVDQTIDLESAILKLEPRQQKALILWAQGYTLKQIAERFDVSHVAIHYWIRDSIELLKKHP